MSLNAPRYPMLRWLKALVAIGRNGPVMHALRLERAREDASYFDLAMTCRRLALQIIERDIERERQRETAARGAAS